MSGSWLATAPGSLAADAATPAKVSSSPIITAPTAGSGRKRGVGSVGISISTGFGPLGSGIRLQLLGGKIGQPRAFASHQRDVPGVLPSPEAVDDVGQA